MATTTLARAKQAALLIALGWLPGVAGAQSITTQLLAPDAAASDFFGIAVAISDSGDTAIVGAYRDNAAGGADSGSASVYVRDAGGNWSFQQKLEAPDGAAGDLFGASVALSADGSLALVGAYQDDLGFSDIDAGSAHIFFRSGSSWGHLEKLDAPGAATGDAFGRAVALSDSGDIALVGAPADDVGLTGTDAGSAHVFERSGVSWLPREQLLAPGGAAGDGFGGSVALSAAGGTALVGAPFDDTAFPGGAKAGSAHVFTGSGSSWTHQADLSAAAAAGDSFGISVSLSDSGDTALVGAFRDDTSGGANAGSAQVFTRAGSSWSLAQQLLAADGAAGDQFGAAVALSGSGEAAWVGAYQDETAAGSAAGSAHLFTRLPDASWVGAQVLAPDAAAGDQFGFSVSLSETGTRAIAGAPFDDTAGGSDAGSATVFEFADTDGDGTPDLTDNCPSLANADPLDTDGDGQGDVCDTDDDDDGLTDAEESALGTDPLLADTDGDSAGDASDNCPLVANASQTNTDGDPQGDVCDDDDDGDGLTDAEEATLGTDPLLTDTDGDDLTDPEEVTLGTDPVLADSDGDNWDDSTELTLGTDPTDVASNPASYIGKLRASDGGVDEWFGRAVALSDSGDTAIVSAIYAPDTAGDPVGAVYVFARSAGGVWSIEAELDAPGTNSAGGPGMFGGALALSGSGDTALVAARLYPTPSGSAHVFTRSGSTWSYQQELLSPDGVLGGMFGYAVALSSSGDTALIGGPYDRLCEEACLDLGSVHVYSRVGGGNYSYVERLLDPDGEDGDRFGYSLALSGLGDIALIGADQDDTAAGADAGSAHVFSRAPGGSFGYVAPLLAPDAAANDRFGSGVALSFSGDTALVGAFKDDTASGTDAGSAHLFTSSGGGWGHEAQWLTDDAESFDNFGNAVALSSAGDVALVGAKFDDTVLGSARLFLRLGSGSWVETQLRAPDAAPGDGIPPTFGHSIALSSDGATALVGAFADDTAAGIDAGSAYVFDVSDTDSDAILDALDNCPSTSNNDQADLDGDGQGDACDDDRDGDGVLNTTDAFPDDAGASTDTDGDGQPDSLTGPSSTGLVEDLDDDGDGLLDTVETNTAVFVDANDTGTDPLLADTDGDGVADGIEVSAGTSPLDPASTPRLFGLEILAPDGTAGDRFGTAVALSASGESALVGAAYDIEPTGTPLLGYGGSVHSFTRGESGWGAEDKFRGGLNSVLFGGAVDLSASGDTVVTGAPITYSYLSSTSTVIYYSGSAYFRGRAVDGSWNPQGQVFPLPLQVAPEILEGVDLFGLSVALSAAGDTALVGAPYRDSTTGVSQSGAAYVYTRDAAGAWSLQQELRLSDGAAEDYFGVAVSLSALGDMALIGALGRDSAGVDAGAAYISTRDVAGVWSEPQALPVPAAAAGDRFGTSLALSASGELVIVGAMELPTACVLPSESLGAGFAWIFSRDSGGSFNAVQKLSAPAGAARDRFGASVALSSSGAVALVGATQGCLDAGAFELSTGPGFAWTFDQDAAGTFNPSQLLLAENGAAGDAFGESVALSDSGGTALVGASWDDTVAGQDAGSAHIFEFPDGDGDGVPDFADNCPSMPNADQADLDADDLGDACDDDRDGDGKSNALDAFPDDGAASTDTDGDGQPDSLTGPSSTGLVEDLDDDGDGLLDTVETNTGVFVDASDTGTDPLLADTDGDGFQDGAEVFAGTNPLDPASNPALAVPSLGPAGFAGLLALLLAGASRVLPGRRRTV